MNISLEDLTAHLLDRLRLVQQSLGIVTDRTDDPGTRFADALDSMAMVEFLAILAEECKVSPMIIEESVERRFGTVAELAAALQKAGLSPHTEAVTPACIPASGQDRTSRKMPGGWLVGTAVRLPATVQPSTLLDAALHRPAGWLEDHAGIRSRRTWADQDPVAAAADAGRECLERAGLPAGDVGALLVTSEAPPLPVGLAAALHRRLDLRPATVALEVGGACTGFLAALWLARVLLPQAGVVLVLAVEAPSRFLQVYPGMAGEAAALFGDAAAAVVLCSEPSGEERVPLVDVVLGSDGEGGRLLHVERSAAGNIELHMDGSALAQRAIRAMAQAIRDLARRHGLNIFELEAVVAHAGNGRMPALLARQLGLPTDRVWSETANTGNLGSASLPIAWALHQPRPQGLAVWTAVGAGLTWGAALTEPPSLAGASG